jgi:CBS domain-containing protein
MNIGDVMTRDVRLASPQQSIHEAARMMAESDMGVLPVGENDRLVGMITDRDIAIRAVAAGKGPDTVVRDVMTEDMKYCFEDDEIGDVAANMAALQVRRLPVLSRQKRLVGIVSLGDIAIATGPEPAGAAVEAISQPAR